MKKPLLLAAFALTLAGATLVASSKAPETSRPLVTESARAGASSPAGRVIAEGRVVTYPGAEVLVGTDFGGTLARVLVSERQAVQKGQLLAELDSSEERAALAAAEARVREAEADLKLAELEVERARSLVASRVGTAQALEKAERDRDAALARRATGLAEAGRLKVLVAKSRIVAPIAGVVMSRHVQTGETVARGSQIATLADLDRVRIEAEVDESDSNRVSLGAPVEVRAEGDRSAVYRGRVEEIPDAVTARRLKPQDPARPSDTRVLLVKVALEEKTPLKLGRRVDVEIGR